MLVSWAVSFSVNSVAGEGHKLSMWYSISFFYMMKQVIC